MKYRDGLPVELGDNVKLGASDTGEVVCDFDSMKFSDGFDRSEWAYLSAGVLIDFKNAGLVHILDYEDDLSLIYRKR